MLAVQWIDRVKREHDLQSDYAAAKLLQVTTQAMSKIRNEKTRTLSNPLALKVADALAIDPMEVIRDQMEEREHSILC